MRRWLRICSEGGMLGKIVEEKTSGEIMGSEGAFVFSGILDRESERERVKGLVQCSVWLIQVDAFLSFVKVYENLSDQNE